MQSAVHRRQPGAYAMVTRERWQFVGDFVGGLDCAGNYVFCINNLRRNSDSHSLRQIYATARWVIRRHAVFAAALDVRLY